MEGTIVGRLTAAVSLLEKCGCGEHPAENPADFVKNLPPLGRSELEQERCQLIPWSLERRVVHQRFDGLDRIIRQHRLDQGEFSRERRYPFLLEIPTHDLDAVQCMARRVSIHLHDWRGFLDGWRRFDRGHLGEDRWRRCCAWIELFTDTWIVRQGRILGWV